MKILYFTWTGKLPGSTGTPGIHTPILLLRSLVCSPFFNTAFSYPKNCLKLFFLLTVIFVGSFISGTTPCAHAQGVNVSQETSTQLSASPLVILKQRDIVSYPDFLPAGDDNPDNFLKTNYGPIDVKGAQFVITDPLPEGSIITNFKAGADAQGEIKCIGGKWIPQNMSGTCTQRVASSNTNICGWNEPAPAPAFSVVYATDDPSWDPCGNDGEPCVFGGNSEKARTQPIANFNICDLGAYTIPNLPDQGQNGSSTPRVIRPTCLKLSDFKREYPQGATITDAVEALPSSSLQIAPGAAAYISYTACTDKVYRIVFFNGEKAGVKSSSEYLTIPTRCDLKNDVNDYVTSMDSHKTSGFGLDVDLACPPADIYFCPQSSSLDPQSALVPPSSISDTFVGGINLTPPDPVCMSGGKTYQIGDNFVTGSTASPNQTKICSCMCNGTNPPWSTGNSASSGAKEVCQPLCGAAAGQSFSKAGDIPSAAYCGTNAALLSGSVSSTGPGGEVSWTCVNNSDSNLTGLCRANLIANSSCSVKIYDSREIKVGNTLDPTQQDSYLGGNADCTNTSPGWTQLTPAAAGTHPVTANITTNAPFYSSMSCSRTNDGVNMLHLSQTDNRSCEVDEDAYTCTAAAGSCDITETTITCSCPAGPASCTSTTSQSNVTRSGQCPSVQSAPSCSTTGTLTYVSAASQTYGGAWKWKLFSKEGEFDRTDYSLPGTCSVVAPLTPPGPCPTASTKGYYIDSTVQQYQCSRDYKYYNCECTADCGVAANITHSDLSTITPATKCAEPGMIASKVTVSGGGTVLNWTCASASEVKSCEGYLDKPLTEIGRCGTALASSPPQYKTFAQVVATGYACDYGTPVNTETGAFKDDIFNFRYECEYPPGFSSGLCTVKRDADAGICGSPLPNVYSNYSEITPANLCVKGTPKPASSSWSYIKWTCESSEYSPLCQVRTKAQSGSCKKYYSMYDKQPATSSASGCERGTYEDRGDTSLTWLWKCSGLYGGPTSHCSAYRKQEPSGGDGGPKCGRYNGKEYYNMPMDISGFCANGSTRYDYTWVPGAAKVRWKCKKSGYDSKGCYAYALAPGR